MPELYSYTKYEIVLLLLKYIEAFIAGTLCITSSYELNCISIDILFPIGIFYILLSIYNFLLFLYCFSKKIKIPVTLVADIFLALFIIIVLSFGLYFYPQCSSWTNYNLGLYIYCFIGFGSSFLSSLYKLKLED